jgi:hypothetical protein
MDERAGGDGHDGLAAALLRILLRCAEAEIALRHPWLRAPQVRRLPIVAVPAVRAWTPRHCRPRFFIVTP